MAPSDDLPVSVRHENGNVILRPEGEIDLSRAPAFRQAIAGATSTSPQRVIVDLEQVSYMDSSGVATLVEAMQNARRNGYTLVLCGMHDRVRSIFEIAKLDVVFQIVPSLDEAITV